MYLKLYFRWKLIIYKLLDVQYEELPQSEGKKIKKETYQQQLCTQKTSHQLLAAYDQ